MSQRTMSSVERSERREIKANKKSRWWIPIGLASVFGGILAFVALLSYAFTVGFLEGFFATNLDGLLNAGSVAIIGAVLLALIVSPVGVYFDRKYVSEVSEWTPSEWYYLSFLGGIGVLLCTVYVWKRYKYVGIP